MISQISQNFKKLQLPGTQVQLAQDYPPPRVRLLKIENRYIIIPPVIKTTG